MREQLLKRYVGFLYAADGCYRGLVQVPLNIGLCLNLLKNGDCKLFCVTAF
jgi:hypothetical protein